MHGERKGNVGGPRRASRLSRRLQQPIPGSTGVRTGSETELSPEISPHTNGQLSFDKDAKTPQRSLLCLRALSKWVGKSELDPLHHTIYKNELKRIRDLNITRPPNI